MSTTRLTNKSRNTGGRLWLGRPSGRSNHLLLPPSYTGQIISTKNSRFENLSRWLELGRHRTPYRHHTNRVYSAPGSYWNGHRF